MKGLNYNSNFTADHPQLIFHNSKLYSTWQEVNSDGKNQIRVAFYQDNLTITDNGTKLILDNSSLSNPLNINRSNCSLNEFDDGENLIYRKLSNSNLDNKSLYFSNLDLSEYLFTNHEYCSESNENKKNEICEKIITTYWMITFLIISVFFK